MKERVSREEFCEIVEAVCRRPKMYTATGTFNEVVAFLEGYALGGANLDEKEYHSRTTPFRKWLGNKFRSDKPAPEDWESAFPLDWNEFLARFSSETEGMSQLPNLYAEYCRFRDSGSSWYGGRNTDNQ